MKLVKHPLMHSTWTLFACLLLLCCLTAAPQARGADNTSNFVVLVDPDNSISFAFLHGPKGAEKPVGHVNMAGWGPNWAWAGIRSGDKPQGPFVVSAPFVVNKARGQAIAIRLSVTKKGTRSVEFQYDLTAEKDVPLTILAATVGFDKTLGGRLVATAGGKQNSLPLPLSKGALDDVTHAVFNLTGIGEISADLEPAGNIGIDGDARFILGAGTFPAGHKTVTLTITFPGDVALVSSPADVAGYVKPLAGADWFAFTPIADLSPSAIGMENWLEKPAGKRGGVRMTGDHFSLEDGTPIKFWGTNLAYGGNCAPDKKTADFTAARFAKYGINAVRLHKFTYPKNEGIGDPNDSTKMDPAGLDRLDYFSAQLKSHGVYFGWSHTYGLKIRPGDRSRLLAYDEIVKAFPGGNTYAFINFAPDVQDLLIETVVNLLKHKNPYTNFTYADEPALCFIELQNEDDIFWYSSANVFNACPTYKKQFQQRFCDWLKSRYKSDEGVRNAWKDALKPGETLAAGNIMPALNPWSFGDDHLPKTAGGDRQRLLDTAAFLHDVQDQYYSRYVKAIRDAGYKGPLNGSPWQAPSMLPHYFNLRSDYAVGYIDRHNYFGGKFTDSLLGNPGSGYLSSGLQQVIDRPFGLSEWITVYPSLFSAEGPVLLAAYGMGLQGWDASYEFQSQAMPRSYSGTAGTLPWGVWDADTPTQLGQFPLLARMIYRGDVKEGPIISTRKISDAELAEGKFSFSDKVTQSGDIKSFTGSTPPQALAAGRVVVEFTPSPQPSTFADLSKFQQGDTIVSSTGQLRWNAAKRYVTIDTEGTKALIGFAPGQDFALGSVHIRSDSDYASIILTASDPGATLATAKSALLTAVARSCNTGFTLFGPEQKILKNGTGPVLMEPVKATIAIAGRRIKEVNVLDADGKRTGKTVSVENGGFAIDGAREKTVYYEVVFE